MQLQPSGKDLNPEPSQKMVYKIDKLAIPGIPLNGWFLWDGFFLKNWVYNKKCFVW